MPGTAKYPKLMMILLIIGLFIPLAAQGRDIVLSNSPSQLKLQNSNDYGFELSISVDKYNLQSVESKAGTFDEISIEGYGFSSRIGQAQLPMTSRIVAVPLSAQVSFEILSQETRMLDRKDSGITRNIIPAQPSVSKSADLNSIIFEQDAAFYARNEFSQNPSFKIEEIGIMRGLRLFQFYFEPIRYNPVSGALEIVSAAEIRVEFLNPDLAATQELLAKTASAEFEALYAKSIFNYDGGSRTQLVRHPTKMLILCPASYTNNIQSYVDWKTQQGFEVNVVTVGTGAMVANNTTAIKSYMQNLWNSATTQNPAPTYLLIIGDESGTITVATNTGATDSHVTDMTYVRLNGSDYLPEMYHGRFSVSSTTELANIINKTITYEKTLMPDLSYLGKTVLIAGADSGYAPTHGNGAINYATAEYFNTAHGITSNNYLYPASQTSDAVIIANANEGRGYMNYTAHGSETSWGDPTFTVSDVNAMTNANKYGVMVGNCCITNWFNYSSPCFGEAIIRKANGGGVAYIGGINSTYWNEDYYWAVGYKTPINGTAPAYNASKLGAYDAMFHSHNETYSNWATTTGESIFMGNMAVQQSGSSLTNYYWEIYHIMGDPSLMTYMGVPTVNNASYPSQILIGATQITVTAAPYSRVALTMGGVIYGTAIVPAGGSLNLPITAFTNMGTAKLTITAQNKITLQTDVSIIPNSGPYVSVSNTVYQDNNNNTPEYNESGRFNVTFQNVGSVAATNLVATLSSSTPGISITDNSETIASIGTGASTTVNNAYTFDIANNVPNGTSAAFTITMVSGSNSWVHTFTQIINAPALAFGNMTISDPSGNNNGRLDPGETATISIALNNTGAAASSSGTGTLNCGTSGITIVNSSANFAAINAGGSRTVSFTVTAASSMTEGTLAMFVFNAAAGAYTANTTVNIEVGAPMEIIIGGGSSTQSYPIDRYYTYSGHEAIYLASEIGTPGSIKSMAFYKASGTDVNSIEAVTVYMKNTTATSLATGNYSTSGYTQVYSGNWENTSTSGWMEVDLNNQFVYDGTNLSILTIKGNQTWTSSYPMWTYSNASANRARQNRNDYSQPTSLTASRNLPNLKLKLFPDAGFTPPTSEIDNDALYANLQVGDEGTDSFTITNTGSQTLSYEISMAEVRNSFALASPGSAKGDRSIAGSTLTLSAVDYTPGATQNWTFTVYNGSTDTEWLKHVIVTFPTGVTVNSVTNFVGGSGGDLVPTPTSGNGITIDWYGISSSNWGVIQGGQTATATVNVSITPSFGGTISIPFQIIGDDYGSTPHTITGTLTIAQAIPPIEWLSIQPLSGSIPAGESLLITGYFSATGMAVGSYEAMLTIHSNDPVNPTLAVSTAMDVWEDSNHAPQIELPASFAFDRNGSLEVSFSSYISDEDLDPLTLGYSGNTNINVDISGTTVTFTTAENWTGTETITFSVYDGFTYAYDSANVTVNEITGPDWVPVIYPNNSATVYGTVSIYGASGQLNDVIGAFVGTECRGIADLVMNGGNAYVTLLVNLASPGENVSFKIYDYSADLAYDALETYNLNFAQVLGTSASPVPISVSEILVLDPPVIDPISTIDEASGYAFTWQPVTNATEYQIFRSLEGPYSGFVLIATTTNLNFTDTTIAGKAFYMIKAAHNPITKGNSK
ncbi:MAG: C25 family cysteine peptidase [Candidatus Cloacimonetes bacterium]|nr:C25 family cysteine peptidase [Candidatus Cloacimonadota bacterium]MCB5287391.1 C25 family cysteine peptidase [Candidatus Cloacimonadota bacterium]MCK9184253.1 C25 family cysteine peptidase [Candidatus Cloacimonadota bacterium]MDY0229713.1 C25 family cysteine peptidase [Candidatus Cloacimonadaceae bacterium]